MKKRVIAAILIFAVIGITMVLLLQDASVQEETSPPEKPKHPMRGMLREEMMRKHPRLNEFEEGKQWLEEAKKYRDEINELQKEFEPLRKEVKRLFSEAQEAETDEDRKKIREELSRALQKLGGLELNIAQKKTEFCDKSFKIALKRKIEAEVEFRETRRRIHWRERMLERQPFGRKFRDRRRRNEENDNPPKNPPDLRLP